jgi:hypothetical protein
LTGNEGRLAEWQLRLDMRAASQDPLDRARSA